MKNKKQPCLSAARILAPVLVLINPAWAVHIDENARIPAVTPSLHIRGGGWKRQDFVTLSVQAPGEQHRDGCDGFFCVTCVESVQSFADPKARTWYVVNSSTGALPHCKTYVFEGVGATSYACATETGIETIPRTSAFPSSVIAEFTTSKDGAIQTTHGSPSQGATSYISTRFPSLSQPSENPTRRPTSQTFGAPIPTSSAGSQHSEPGSSKPGSGISSMGTFSTSLLLGTIPPGHTVTTVVSISGSRTVVIVTSTPTSTEGADLDDGIKPPPDGDDAPVSDYSSGFSQRAKIGVGVGCGVLVALVAGCAFVFCGGFKRSKRGNNTKGFQGDNTRIVQAQSSVSPSMVSVGEGGGGWASASDKKAALERIYGLDGSFRQDSFNQDLPAYESPRQGSFRQDSFGRDSGRSLRANGS
ncbi:hypothetical protein QBC35DRAFT_531983 [Podospora australis]|uniref:Mid2 domain-containing protein n=1 Tax=Podospora australis TaxID=1536484 RepID=A0AAN6WV11_9PEZI|nr:hypothetical protein QBC35DRAFT_531983 [Podospora australis]